ncbi:hypothetical protein J8L85_11610 [Maribacter sp. MMG018]|uniref:hypothetical protein n=1 Tax=Maribacter sp. MMG018 TaxID=2822688 RepID=UPI001B371205|nr:hypothetical protein [Maribacter sp. MMG018]MBQ4915088.1 hypothetical protein [Maribacter sp. MMG018]
MKLVKSELILEDFFIVNSNYNFIEPEKDSSINPKEYIKDYDIDIDFVVRDIKKEDNKYLVFAKVNVNNMEEKLPGYSIFAEAVSIFSFDTSTKLNEKQKSEFLWSSGVSISINSLRGYLSTMTSFCPLGKYVLPSVDLTTLLNKKRESIIKSSNKKK